MKCHYEVLNVPRNADEAEIKSAYKKLALKWHPDKNLEDTENAKEQFQLVQQAYEVLSDRQERAWYDNHREQILHRSNGPKHDNCLDVYQYFTSSCFKGYGDDDNGFYCIYRGVFEEIAKEDLEYMENKNEFCSVPSFGLASSYYEDVVGPFYAHWMSYSTKRSYVWLDPYNMDNTRDRRILKLVDKENKKVRLKAKKERNEEVRALVAFVRKRDKRVQQYSKQLELKNLENRMKQGQISKQKRMERNKELIDSSDQAEWTKFGNVESELAQIEKSLAEEFGEEAYSDESDDENLYCVACNKVFKTPKAFGNHESSKKHKENVQKLKTEMEEDSDLIDNEFIDESDLSDRTESDSMEEIITPKKNKSNEPDGDDVCDENVNLDTIVDSNEDLNLLPSLNSNKNDKNPKNETAQNQDLYCTACCKGFKTPRAFENHESSENHKQNTQTALESSEEEGGISSIIISNEEHNDGNTKSADLSVNSNQETFEETSQRKTRKKSKKIAQKQKGPKDIVLDTTIDSDEDFDFSASKKSKKKGRKPKQKAGQQESKSEKIHEQEEEHKSRNACESNEDVVQNHYCVTCNSNFPSKNKLFIHLKKTGHTVPIPANVNVKKSKVK